MLLDLLSKYLENVEAAIRKLEGVYVEHYEEEILATNRQNNLVFRYDNTPHFPEVKSFPHHKQLPNKVVSGEGPSIFKIIEEAKQLAQ